MPGLCIGSHISFIGEAWVGALDSDVILTGAASAESSGAEQIRPTLMPAGHANANEAGADTLAISFTHSGRSSEERSGDDTLAIVLALAGADQHGNAGAFETALSILFSGAASQERAGDVNNSYALSAFVTFAGAASGERAGAVRFVHGASIPMAPIQRTLRVSGQVREFLVVGQSRIFKVMR